MNAYRLNSISVIINLFAWLLLLGAITVTRHQREWIWVDAIMYYWPSLLLVALGSILAWFGRPKS